MKIKIVGIQDQSYKLDNGYSFDGFKIHAIDQETSNDRLTGNLVMNLRLDRSSPFASDLEIGGEYSVYFNQKGAVDFFQRVDKK